MSNPLHSCCSAIFTSCRFAVVAVFVLLCTIGASAQEVKQLDLTTDTAVTDNTDTVSAADSALSDSAKVANKEQELGVRISKDALPAAVTTTAKDSAVLDMKASMYYLYGDAKATYQDVGVQSGVLIFNQKTNVLSAIPILDTGGKKVSVQEFKQGEETFTYDTLKYNFKSKRAIVRNAHSKYGDGFVISEQVKRNPDESIYGYKSIYTTCNLDHPHFGIRARKIKVIPGRIIAAGPANLEIMDIPTPLFLPFGMFPIKQGQRSGFILPTYTISDALGVGLQRGGYYFAVNDNLGVISQFDLFSKGSWAAFITGQYATRYRYNGSLALEYSYQKIGEDYEINPNSQVGNSKDFKVTWTHQVDPKAHPGTSFSASVNFGTRSFNLRNSMNIVNSLNNQYSSSISYGKTWVGKPYSLTIGLRHSQSTEGGAMSITLPEVNFNLGQFSPFQRKIVNGTPRWYEKITATYSVSLINQLNTYDSLFSLSKIAWNDMNNAIKHTASIQANYNVFRYFNWSISIPYNEYWNTRQLFQRYNPVTQHTDSTSRTGFFATRDFNVTTSLSTRIYGMALFKKGKIAGLRHVITPSIGLSYQPGFAFAPFGYMYETVGTDGRRTFASPYSTAPYGGPSNAEDNGSVSFSLGNTLQMKIRNRDSTGKAKTTNISLIDGLGLNASYNMFADSFRLSNITMNFRTSILQKFNLYGSATFDPYRYNSDGRRTPEYLFNTGGGLAALRNANGGLSMSFQGKKKNEKEQAAAESQNGEVKRLLQNGGYNDYYDFNIPWNLSINASLNVQRLTRVNTGDTTIFTPNLTFNGGFNLTERWKVDVTSGLQFVGFKKVDIAMTQLNISRDLHCWQMSLNLIPFGYLRSFNFTLQVKSSVLQDLKLTRRKNYQDANY
ncbi:putative LPS assembly protein LptD [Taibaiella koreensis]|uniref:putative LPS assembly protein LptD n=1 Tax=Taibaiella koreensis TaxID=1268548 RepID=UPI000E5993E7|nr:putative LPS assembly protein LptD [Taibaiella koreensis]